MSGTVVRYVTAATMTAYQDLSQFERGVTVGAREMGHGISDVAMIFGFSLTTISRLYREYQESVGIPCLLDVFRCSNGKCIERLSSVTVQMTVTITRTSVYAVSLNTSD
ncbi:HTH_Tnp_Tc3_2 domain-containing protein [Trichonephila clavipes]|nr:HTH_Tnp_Tc3_2 domain-containing protein [Trichonephila clavipes]